MAKIKVEIEVPYGEYCHDCKYCGCGEDRYCILFDKELKAKICNYDWGIIIPYRCDECKKAEIEE